MGAPKIIQKKFFRHLKTQSVSYFKFKTSFHLVSKSSDLWVEVVRSMNVVVSLRTIHSWGVSSLGDADTAFWEFFWKLKNKINDDACRKCFPGGSFQCAAVDLGVRLARMLGGEIGGWWLGQLSRVAWANITISGKVLRAATMIFVHIELIYDWCCILFMRKFTTYVGRFIC